MAHEDFYTEAVAAIRACDREKAAEVATRGLAAGVAPEDMLKLGFIPGIAKMGDLFERGEVFLPELVLAADAMTGAAAVCNEALPEGEGGKKATVVIGTVQGVQPLHKDHYAAEVGVASAATVLREHDGMRHVVSVLKGGYTSALAITDTAVAEVWKDGVRIS